ncbi:MULTISPECIES: hypothetical protein [unclassified Plantactinospora]|uniref:hypothetical protein n=1 Tax=unclassified Plantactinospora TaxID=2631981 RepID=UPI000D17C400|nr:MULTISPECIES: hypothetical protein [unclassified Plantactinospora]AVT31760.1 hypothetical protein C6361_22370 [Plantactinospora sp. BC1]AVT37917.1 hypothetical protein C6W10_17325 [Plantactinospora sp. BB1]
MTGTRTRQPTGPARQDGPPASVAVVLLGVEALLIVLSVCAAVLEQTALAVMAGTAAVTLAGEIVRRYLTPGPERHSGGAGTDPGGESGVPAPPPGTDG